LTEFFDDFVMQQTATFDCQTLPEANPHVIPSVDALVQLL
jgi:hypothetical protein